MPINIEDNTEHDEKYPLSSSDIPYWSIRVGGYWTFISANCKFIKNKGACIKTEKICNRLC